MSTANSIPTARHGHGPIGRALEKLRSELTYRRARHQLEDLDAHSLRDIGLHRADIARAVRYGRI